MSFIELAKQDEPISLHPGCQTCSSCSSASLTEIRVAISTRTGWAGHTSSISAAGVTRHARDWHRLRLAVSGSAGPPLAALSARRSAFVLRLGLLLRLLLRRRLLLRVLVLRRVLALVLRVLALLCWAAVGGTPGGLHAHAAHLCLHTPQTSASCVSHSMQDAAAPI